MPIEFCCANCSKLLRTPDESAGKKAKCPECGTIADVPLESHDTGIEGRGGVEPTPTSGAPFSSENPFTESVARKPAPSMDAENPYASPAMHAARPVDESIDRAPTKGLPWEREKSAGSFWETTKLIMTSPTHAFSIMHREGGFGTPLLFGICDFEKHRSSSGRNQRATKVGSR